MACALAMMSSGFSANAAETADLEDASRLSFDITGSCGCTMTIETVSKRRSVRNDDKTHTAEYFVSCSCVHGVMTQSEFIIETHLYGQYDSGRHIGEKCEHVYVRSCIGGDRDVLPLLCFGNPNSSGGHAQP